MWPEIPHAAPDLLTMPQDIHTYHTFTRLTIPLLLDNAYIAINYENLPHALYQQFNPLFSQGMPSISQQD